VENRAPSSQKHADQQRKEQPQKNPHKAGFLAGPTSEKSPMANLNVVRRQESNQALVNQQNQAYR
jgi:hypothetical protein